MKATPDVPSQKQQDRRRPEAEACRYHLRAAVVTGIRTFFFLLVLKLVCVPGVAAGQVPEVIDTRCPGTAMRELKYVSPARTYQPTYVGDVDGDGFSDVILYEAESLDITAGYTTVLVYGSPSGTEITSFRRTVFEKEVGGEEIGKDDGGHAPFAPAGDVNGDGRADFFLAYGGTNWAGLEITGLVLLVFGRSDFPARVSLADLAHSDQVVRFVSRTPSTALGRAVGLAGDLNGDGRADLVLTTINVPGIHGGEWGGGRAYVLLDWPREPGEVVVEDVGRSVSGFVLQGAYGHDQASGHNDGDELCEGVGAAGDVNGDGLDDLVIGAPRTSRGGLQERGAVYVVFGRSKFSPEYVNDRPEEFGVEILGAGGLNYFGWQVAGAGDVDGDGLQDFVVGATSPTAPGFYGNAYLIYGSRSWPSSISVSDPSLRVFHISETPPPPALREPFIDFNGWLGGSVAGLGDWNGDGFPDFAVGAPRQTQRLGLCTGTVNFIWGGPGLPSAARDDQVGTSALPGARMVGKDGYWELGDALDARGDFDGDGSPDLLVLSNHFPFTEGVPREEASLYVVSRRDQDSLRVCSARPSQGSAEGGAVVDLVGGGFQGGERVLFGGVEALSVEVLTSAEARVTAPPWSGPVGPVDLEVVRGNERALLKAGFTYFPEGAPPELLLDDATVAGGSPRILEIRNWTDGPKTFGTRQFAATYFADLNGDGIDDLVIACFLDGPNDEGEVSIIFGGKKYPPGGIDWEDIPKWGTRIRGDIPKGNFGRLLAAPGDLDGDGLADLAVGNIESVFVIRGRKDWASELAMADEVAAGRAFALSTDGCGAGVPAGPGDLEGDGVRAFVLGTMNCEAREAAVRMFLDGFAAGGATQPSILIRGEPQAEDESFEHFGTSVGGVGDVNGDGSLDFVVGSVYTNRKGRAFIILGGDWSFRDAGIEELIDAGRAVLVRREQDFTEIGALVGPAGDFDGDGLQDVLLELLGGGPDFRGEADIVYGATDLGGAVKDIDLGVPGHAQMLVGEDPFDYSGSAVALGDLDGDGYADIGVVAGSYFSAQSRAYVVYGGPRFGSVRSLGDLGSRGFRILDKDGTWFSGQRGAIAAGDLDGDGRKDIAIGEMTPKGKRVLVIFGGNGWGRPVPFMRGEVNGDGTVNLSDAVAILSYLFLGVGQIGCLDAADTNDSGAVDLTDAVYLLSYLFLGSSAPPAPFPDVGSDPTADSLGPCLR